MAEAVQKSAWDDFWNAVKEGAYNYTHRLGNIMPDRKDPPTEDEMFGPFRSGSYSGPSTVSLMDDWVTGRQASEPKFEGSLPPRSSYKGMYPDRTDIGALKGDTAFRERIGVPETKSSDVPPESNPVPAAKAKAQSATNQPPENDGGDIVVMPGNEDGHGVVDPAEQFAQKNAQFALGLALSDKKAAEDAANKEPEPASESSTETSADDGEKSLDDYETFVKRLKARGITPEIDYGPLVALVDSWTGSNLGRGYRPPERPLDFYGRIAQEVGRWEDKRSLKKYREDQIKIKNNEADFKNWMMQSGFVPGGWTSVRSLDSKNDVTEATVDAMRALTDLRNAKAEEARIISAKKARGESTQDDEKRALLLDMKIQEAKARIDRTKALIDQSKATTEAIKTGKPKSGGSRTLPPLTVNVRNNLANKLFMSANGGKPLPQDPSQRLLGMFKTTQAWIDERAAQLRKEGKDESETIATITSEFEEKLKKARGEK